MSLQNYYEEIYINQRLKSDEELLHETQFSTKGLFQYAQEMKEKFLPSRDWSECKILEMGAGRGGVSLHLAKLGAKVTLVDFSTSALEQAKRLYESQGQEVNLVVGDVSHPDIKFSDKFDLIIDSHLLHCLCFDPDRLSYYSLINESLAEDGIFIAETMVHRKKMFIPEGFMFDEQYLLWQRWDQWIPVRRILDSLDLEKEIQSTTLQIAYFYYYGQFGFVPHKTFLDLPTDILPAAVRLVLKRK